eukprot:TRINITY_DN5065_c0_g1_i1.p1 TRINITY_DN5065_c0_g1~~TRINITY_DN5065_c0_g1_i1.p1  ORF type:complete len:54 (-),score=6.32 TRINITY_DN5065_c0_g1_i1:236-397(-)
MLNYGSIYDTMNLVVGAYKAGFAKSQEAYENAYDNFSMLSIVLKQFFTKRSFS